MTFDLFFGIETGWRWQADDSTHQRKFVTAKGMGFYYSLC
jgi:hypothetical protein